MDLLLNEYLCLVVFCWKFFQKKHSVILIKFQVVPKQLLEVKGFSVAQCVWISSFWSDLSLHF